MLQLENGLEFWRIINLSNFKVSHDLKATVKNSINKIFCILKSN